MTTTTADATATLSAPARRRRRRGRSTFGSLHLRGATWYIRLTVKGKHIWRAVAKDRSLAEARLAEMRAALEREEVLGVRAVARVTFKEFWLHLEPILRARHTEKTFAAEKGRYAVIERHFDGAALSDIDVAQVRDFLARLRTKSGFSPATTNRYMAFLSVAFRYAIDRGCARANPTVGIRRAKEEMRPVAYLSGEDIDRILARVEPLFRPFITLAADTGARRQEVLDLTWQDVDFARKVILIRRSKTKLPRQVPMMERAIETLGALYKARGPIPAVGAARVFPHLDPVNGGSSVSKAFQRAARLAGFTTLRLHDLRHAFASGLAHAGVGPGVIGSIIGDTSYSVIYRYSKHAPQGAEADAVKRLSEGRSGKAAEALKVETNAAAM